MKFILKASVWDSDADNESIMEDKSHYTEDGNCWTMKPQQFRKLKEIKIQVLYLIVNVIHFQQGKDFLPSFFFLILLPALLSPAFLSVSDSVLLSLSKICCLYFSASVSLFVSLSLFLPLSLPLTVFPVSLSLSLEFYKEGLPKSSIWAFLWHGGKRLADTLQSMTLRSYLFSW